MRGKSSRARVVVCLELSLFIEVVDARAAGKASLRRCSYTIVPSAARDLLIHAHFVCVRATKARRRHLGVDLAWSY